MLDPPLPIVRLLAYQLDVPFTALTAYGEREQNRSDHTRQNMRHLGYRRATAKDLQELEDWLIARALEHERPAPGWSRPGLFHFDPAAHRCGEAGLLPDWVILQMIRTWGITVSAF